MRRYSTLSGLASLLAGFLIAAQGAWASEGYEFPASDSYVSTVLGTPKKLRTKLPDEIPVQVKSLDNLGPMPEVFWYNDSLKYSVALQDGPAPLVFSIGGTGSAYNNRNMVGLQKALYQAGFHVINISSPTHLNFLLSASTSHMAGYAPEDAKDIYRVMQQAYATVKDDIKVTGMHVIGYSLGGLHAAFVSDLDRREKRLNLQRVYMINPPVDLYSSAQILDKLTEDNIPKRSDGHPYFGAFIDAIISALAETYDPAKGIGFNEDALYATYREGDTGEKRKYKHTAGGLIGFSFRLTSGSMVFASDVMNHAGYIVPKEKEFTAHEPLQYYFRAAHAISFKEYVDELLIPTVQSRNPGKNAEQIIRESSLRQVETFLASSPDVRVATNSNDLILAPGELDYLKTTLGSRIKVYPAGGHMGNILHATNVADMVAFLKGGQQQ